MVQTYDCIVLGVGGFGSGALYHLARRGLRVLGIDRFGVAHDRGSSHGETRIIRKAYFEHPDYVPLVLRAYGLWNELESASGRRLCELCGLMLAGPSGGEAISGARLAARMHDLAIDDIPLAEARRRFPGFRFAEDVDVVFEADAGFLAVEDCVRTHIEQAQRRGAELRTNEAVIEWSVNGDSIRLRTDRNEYEAARMIVTAGAWTRQILADLSVSLKVVRKPLFWHAVTADDYSIESGSPGFYIEQGERAFYGFPAIDGQTVKVAEHTGGLEVDDPLTVDRDVHPADSQPVSEFVRSTMPGLKPEPSRHAVCMYTHTADNHFIIDRHPEFENVAIGAGFSGHGFKFTTVLGEALADIAVEGQTKLPVGFLRLGRDGLR